MFELLAGLGAGLQVYGAIKGAQDQADVDRQKALFQRQQADEVDSRARINDVQMQDTEIRSKLQFGSQYAASGHEGIGIGSQLEIQRQEGVQQSFQDREAAFQSKMLREGASLDQTAASETEESGYINAAGTLLGTGGKIMQPASGNTSAGSAQGLPAPSAARQTVLTGSAPTDTGLASPQSIQLDNFRAAGRPQGLPPVPEGY